MLIFPAIDLIGGEAVRLIRGDFNQKTVYGTDPAAVAGDFVRQGATHVHLVDLDAAKSGIRTNTDTILTIKQKTRLFCEVGGGIRSMADVSAYLDRGIDRVIIGSAAVTDPVFLRNAVAEYGDRIAVGVDLKNGRIALHGWTDVSDEDPKVFFSELARIGVKTVICTDISRDGCLNGPNRALYRTLSRNTGMQISASGGVSSIADIRELAELNLYGAIVGKAYYTGAVSLAEAIEVAKT